MAGLMGPIPLKYHMSDSRETEMERWRERAGGKEKGGRGEALWLKDGIKYRRKERWHDVIRQIEGNT